MNSREMLELVDVLAREKNVEKDTVFGVLEIALASAVKRARFPGEDAIAQIPEYERRQLAQAVYNGFYNASDEIPRPYPKNIDFYDAVPAYKIWRYAPRCWAHFRLCRVPGQ